MPSSASEAQRARKILLDVFWQGQWKNKEDRIPSPAQEDFLRSCGYWHDPVIQSHDQWIVQALAISCSLTAKEAGDAFLPACRHGDWSYARSWAVTHF